jgi:glucan biosynthesis protein C
MTVTQAAQTSTPAEGSGGKSARLHYLDWLQVLAILGVFLFHAVHPFDDLFPWHIKNAEPSILVNFFVGFFGPWGMPFFFLMAGLTSWFSLRRRTAGRYVRERVVRLLVPFLAGAILLTPIQAYYELTHSGWWKGDSILEFILSPEVRTYFFTKLHPLVPGPKLFGALGYHLWFVGFLFAFSLLALPVFLWLNKESGQRFLASLARLAAWRGGLLVFVIPPVLARFVLHPAFPDEHDWADFAYMLLSFASGYILIADERLMRAVRRDRRIYLTLGIVCTLFFFSSAAGVPVSGWMGSPTTPWFYLSWAVFGINSWSWTMFIFYVGMRYLNHTSNWLEYGREASYPFFMIHQPAIIFIAFYVVQWEVSLLIKLLMVVVGSFALSLGLYELLVRRIGPVRALLGMKPRSGGNDGAPRCRSSSS